MFMLGFLSMFTIKYSLGPHNAPLPGHGVFTVAIFIAVICYFFFRQLQVKAINITFGDEGIILKKYVPVGKPKHHLYSSLDGFKTGRVDNRNVHYEILYLVKDGKTIAQISGYIHENYDVMKAEIITRLKYLGEIVPPILDL